MEKVQQEVTMTEQKDTQKALEGNYVKSVFFYLDLHNNYELLKIGCTNKVNYSAQVKAMCEKFLESYEEIKLKE